VWRFRTAARNVQAHEKMKDRKLVCCVLILIASIALVAILLILKIVSKFTS
jgi:hypothetical protein